jgi:dsDNA-specific endonuclease/ATPase MutS2
MNQNTLEKLQYNQIIEELKTYCSSSLGKKEVDRIRPYTDYTTIKRLLGETTEAKNLLDVSGSFGLSGTENILQIMDYLEKDMILNEEQAYAVLEFLLGSKRIITYMKDKEFYAPNLYAITMGLVEKQEVIDEIDATIKNGYIMSEASSTLKNVRRHIINTREQIRDGLEKFLRNKQNQSILQDNYISERNGRLTVPVKASYKKQVEGTVVETSKKTAFIEPNSVRKYTDKLDGLLAEEADEIYRILCKLTALVYDEMMDLKNNLDILGYLDMTFAKAKYAKAVDGVEPKLNNYGYIHIVNGKHMLLSGDVVPLNVTIGETFRNLTITGPNAGGKTVVLKTIGLLTLAVQTGLHIPCEKGTEISIFERIFVDIGDDQSLENSLSTFSSHVKNLAVCVNKTNKSTLLLFDEIGSGTEPSEGSALAIAILEDVYKKGAITIATTHYNEIKHYAKLHPDYETAAMRFNKETLEPLYKLVVGKSGESNALWISKKMGIYDQILDKASSYMQEKEYDISVVDSTRIRKYEDDVRNNEIHEYDNYVIGDRVYVRTEQRTGLVYKPVDHKNYIEVFFDGEVKKLHGKLLELEASAKDLYPVDYDMDQLFISFRDRKLEKDIRRGSKKVLKEIQKEIRNK